MATPAESSWARLRGWALVLGVAGVLLNYEPTAYRKLAVPGSAGGGASGGEDAEALSRRAVTKAAAWHASISRPGGWETAMSADEVNAWLAVDLPRNHSGWLPLGVTQPRIAFLPQHALLGARVGYGPLTAVALLDFEIQLRDVNHLAIVLEQARGRDSSTTGTNPPGAVPKDQQAGHGHRPAEARRSAGADGLHPIDARRGSDELLAGVAGHRRGRTAPCRRNTFDGRDPPTAKPTGLLIPDLIPDHPLITPDVPRPHKEPPMTPPTTAPHSGTSLTFLGAAGMVSGSRHLLDVDGSRVLVDCGLFQGEKHLRERNWDRFPVPANSIDAVVLTHGHIDHSGWLPRLAREGFQGQILTSPATADLLGLLLYDSAKCQEEDAAYANRKGFPSISPRCLSTMKRMSSGRCGWSRR